MKKHVIYAEDLIDEIMKYPSRDFSKALIRHCAAAVVEDKQVSLWQHICQKARELVKR